MAAMTDNPTIGNASSEHSPHASHVLELVRAASELTFLVDPDKKIVYAGQSLSALLGYDPLHVIGHPVQEMVHPNHATPLDNALTEVFRGSKLGEAELRWPHRSGTGSLPLMVSFAPLGQGDVTEGTMIRARHANTLKAIEAALVFDDQTVVTAAETSPIVIFLLDERGRCVWINNTWTAISGQTPEQSFGLGWVSMIEEVDRDGFRSVAAQAHQRKSGWRQQFRVRSTSGELYWIDGAAAPRLSASGAVAGYVVALADITAEVRARAELNKRTTIVESNAEFVVMDERSQRLVYNTDQNTPLSQTPPVPAMEQAEDVRPSLGAVANTQQAHYLNEIRPTVLSSGIWQEGVPAQPASVQPAAEDTSRYSSYKSESPIVPIATPEALETVEATPTYDPAYDTPPLGARSQTRATKSSYDQSNSTQPIAWNFDTPEVAPGPVEGWQGPSWTGSDPTDSETASPNDTVYVGLVGPSGSVESIASVSDAVLEPTEFEVADMLPAMDPVTGLANRALFQERIRLAMHRMSRDGVSVAVMFANLHGYEELRHEVGAKTGDDQLFVVAKRLEATIRQVDTVARIGDADFAVLGVGWFFPGDVENAARRFMVKIQEPLPSIGRQANLQASMGVAMALPDESIAMLLRRAQRARKIAYGFGPGSVHVDSGPER